MDKITSFFVTALFLHSLSLCAQQDFLDATFGTNGMVYQSYTDTVFFGSYESDFKSIALQSGGKFIMGSNFHQHGPNQRYVLNQYLTDGTLNAAFGANGVVASNVNNNIGAVQLQSEGKIIVSSVEGDYDSSFSYLTRYNAEGLPDITFGINGILLDNLSTVRSFLIQQDNKIVVAKTPGNGGFSSNFTIERYSADGIMDAAFGNGGKTEFSVAQSVINLEKMVIQNDGKIVVCGLIRSNAPNDYSSNIILIRFENDGSLDGTFGNQGSKVFDYGDNDYIHDVLIQQDGKLVFSSSSYDDEAVNRIIRVHTSGSLDTSFGTEGIKTIEYPILKIHSITQSPDGKLIVAGIYETSINPTPEDNPTPTAIIMASYDDNGDLDLDFGVEGYITTPIAFHRVLDNQLFVQSDGKILVGATISNPWFSTHPRAVVLRYNSTQALSVADVENKPKFVLYPNPVNEVVTLEFSLSQPETISVDLYDSNGRFIINLVKNNNFIKGSNSLQLPLPATLAKGLYFLTLSSGTATETVKMLKQ